MLTKLSIQFPDQVPKEDHDKILKDWFFYAIRSELWNSIRHLYDNESITFSQLLVKARRNEEEESASWIVNKKVMLENDSSLEQWVDCLIAKSNSNLVPSFPTNRDNSQNYGQPPFQSNPRSKGDYRQTSRCPLVDIRQHLRGPEPSAAGTFGQTDGSQPTQCFRCRGWGHPKRLCPPHLNYTQGEWYGTIPPRSWTRDQKVPLLRTHLLSNKYESITSGWQIS